MANSKLGEKHECHECGAKFYDLGKDPVVCPKCGTDQRAEEVDSEPETAPEVDDEDLPTGGESDDEDDDLDDDLDDDDLDDFEDEEDEDEEDEEDEDEEDEDD